ncbi:MAG: mannitol dehydrogenase family protein, partial [Paraglaciecola sp.]|nr:mannitol dehydrogenase family protein [Paraglaciecola sp.]
RHLLAQIAWDGSQKIPMRILPAINDNLAAGRSIARLSSCLAAWFLFIRRRASEGEKLVDPLADTLLALADQCTGQATHDVPLFLALDTVFPIDLSLNAEFLAAVIAAYQQLTVFVAQHASNQNPANISGVI